MRRRDFALVLAGTALLRPLVAHAQQAGKLPRIGYLSDEVAVPDPFRSQNAVLEGLRALGYVDGRDIVIEYRYAAGKVEQLPSLATEIAALPVDVILAVGTPAARAAIAATKTIPIVFARIADPVGLGLVAGLARPGGNATGVSFLTTDLAGKRLELLKDAVRGLTRVAVLYEQNFPPGELELKELTAAARSLEMQLHAVGVPRYLAALQGTLPDIMKESPQALFVGSSGWFEDNHREILDLAIKSRELSRNLGDDD